MNILHAVLAVRLPAAPPEADRSMHTTHSLQPEPYAYSMVGPSYRVGHRAAGDGPRNCAALLILRLHREMPCQAPSRDAIAMRQ